ncbi:MAG TPA: hypothetical protein VEN12_04995, partial [Verrucomicrobiae bacterium]|nr:hypothetical protein [Verrucomicrobiae bacterium]
WSVGRKALLPVKLLRGPFTVDEARRAGLDRWHLEGDNWMRVGPAAYVWRDLGEDPLHTLEASKRRLPRGFAFSGLTAAWLHGLDVVPCNPVEATVPEDAGVSAAPA